AGPIVTIIGLSLSGTATGWASTNGGSDYSLITICVALITFFVICFVSEKGSKNLKLIPFLIGIGAGYVVALLLTVVGVADLVDLSIFSNMNIFSVPRFTFVQAITQHPEGLLPIDGTAFGNIAMTFVPIAIVELAQHIGDHKNLGSIINRDLITDPGLDKTLIGDGVGSAIGAAFGGAANTTYGESIACVAITGNASISTISLAALGCMILSFFGPFVAVINSIPKSVMGGACIALYGFIAVSGLKMLGGIDLGDNKNLFPISAILVIGIGGLVLSFGHNPVTGGALLQLSSLATALFVGLVTKAIVS
ncbi:MAG: uracil-xanthine permease, partial [Erysipelotrichaceae bacterium]|nr:uracil-xanthine permease [Erysipelotrichaceae bacterium]